MASESAPGHSEEIMVAQPVDTITPPAHASVRDGSVAKETQHTDVQSDASFSYSEDSPDKKIGMGSPEKKDEEVRGRDLAPRSTSRRNFMTPSQVLHPRREFAESTQGLPH